MLPLAWLRLRGDSAKEFRAGGDHLHIGIIREVATSNAEKIERHQESARRHFFPTSNEEEASHRNAGQEHGRDLARFGDGS